MPRPKAILQNEYPYHVSGRSINREWFKLNMDSVWEIFSRQLTFITWAYDVRIHAFVLMNNHFHLLVTTPNSNLSQAMANLMRETTRFINMEAGRTDQAYGKRHFRSVIHSPQYFLHAYKYIYRNPVRAGVAFRCEDYKYSSLHFLLGMGYASFPVVEDTTLFSDVEGTLDWLNTEPCEQDHADVKWAMKQSRFRLPRDRATKGPSHLEVSRL